MASIDSRASSPINCTIADTPLDQAQKPNTQEIRHPQYYFEDGNIIFMVEDTLYNVHRYFFARDSSHFRTIFQEFKETGPHVLSDVTCVDFDEFLGILYPTDFRHPTKKTTAQWTSILHLSAKWGFDNIHILAIDNLTAHATPIDKIVLGRRYGITAWLPGAYESVCMRAEPLTVEEGMKLGVEDTVKISATRQLYGSSKARYVIEQLSGDIGQIFGLEKPTEDKTASEHKEEDETMVLLERQVAEARADCLVHPIPTPQNPLGDCVDHVWAWDDYVGGPVFCNSCGGMFETENEAIENGLAQRIARKLQNLEAKLESRRQELTSAQKKGKEAKTM